MVYGKFMDLTNITKMYEVRLAICTLKKGKFKIKLLKISYYTKNS